MVRHLLYHATLFTEQRETLALNLGNAEMDEQHLEVTVLSPPFTVLRPSFDRPSTGGRTYMFSSVQLSLSFRRHFTVISSLPSTAVVLRTGPCKRVRSQEKCQPSYSTVAW